MRRLLLLSILVLATFVPRAVRAGGVSLRWDNCYSDGGVANKMFACDTNAGSERLVMSFVPDADMPQVGGLESRLFVLSVSATLPAWWQFKNTGTCRLASLSLSTALPPGSVNCVDWSSGNAAGGIGTYNIGAYSGPNGVFVTTAVAVPPGALVALFAGQEYFASSLVINHAKTVGSGACGGCDQPVCLVYDHVTLDAPDLSNNQRLMNPAFGTSSEFAHWQNGQEANVQIVHCDSPNLGCFYSFSCEFAATPTRAPTWGSVKALYR